MMHKRLSEKLGTKAGVVGELFSMHLERSRGESNKFEPTICIDCGGGVSVGASACLVIYSSGRMGHARPDSTCTTYYDRMSP